MEKDDWMSWELAKKRLSWSPAFQGLELALDEVHLWLACPGRIAEPRSGYPACAWSGGRERPRVSGLSDRRQQEPNLEARVALKILIGFYTGYSPDQIALEHGPGGKPELGKSLQRLQFSYSMSSGYLLYAFSRNRELGVDIEIHPRDVHVQRLRKRILSKQEREYFDRLPGPQQHSGMLDWWTRKEAYGKLLGVGIRYNMNKTTLVQDPDSFCWKSPVSGLFENSLGRVGFDHVYGTQIELPTDGSAALMYNSPNPDRSHPNIKAFNFAGSISAATGPESKSRVRTRCQIPLRY